ncbi:hypothetical protein BC937DRAFT_87891 [Endogone sp. FLAS-F59071]|nr:hypothetical protein BC937DRAFT_87891 [Endogone sp. FLAS-F59071]|eukprot:RUS19176.1 hypothetical protein BC937DRAFT_87891 [Endogone sp. FLAS-F59071]
MRNGKEFYQVNIVIPRNQVTASLQQINAAMEQRRMNILDLTWTLDGLGKEIGQLAPERTAAESFAAEAVRMAKQRDPKVEELCKW